MNSFSAFVSVSTWTALTACLTLAGCSAAPDEAVHDESLAATSEALSSKCARTDVDPILAVPAGNRLAFNLDAAGIQIYACQVTATGFGWVFQAPEAALSDKHGRVAGTHYAGPTWEAKDGSKVVAARVAGASPDPTSIPWLLLQAVSHAGRGRMSTITYIQRIDTVGGLAPTSGCAADHVGDIARVDYTASYAFFEAGSPPCGCK